MIKNTFNILNGIGVKLEKRLWQTGILDWDNFLSTKQIGFINPGRKKIYDDFLKEAGEKLNEKDMIFFAKAIKTREHWRLFRTFRNEAVALDIETNGLPSNAGGCVTVVGLYNGFDYISFVRGENLTRQRIEKELSGYKYLITFFGSGFDMPFLRESLGITFAGLHFDLFFGGRMVGLKGGLKKVEEKMGITRDESIKGFSGFDAVKLWAQAQRGSAEALDLLIKYNMYDTVNLFDIAERIYEMLTIRTGINLYGYPQYSS